MNSHWVRIGNYVKVLPQKFIFPAHSFLISIFFITHGYSEHQDVLTITSLLPLLLKLLIASLVFYFVFLLLMKSKYKAGLFVTILLAICLFYGAIENFLGIFSMLDEINRLRYVLPALILLLIGCFVWIKRSRNSFRRTNFFFNLLFVGYIIADLLTIAFNQANSQKPNLALHNDIRYNNTDPVSLKPDIYLVILDEYAGTECLKEYFNYDNCWFEDSLKKMDFQVIQSPRSNYKSTNLSIGSLLNMRYFKRSESEAFGKTFEGAKTSLKAIENNLVCSYLENEGYKISNFSIFNLHNNPTPYTNTFIPVNANVITEKTVFNQVLKSAPQLMAMEIKVPWVRNWLDKDVVRNNKHILKHSLPVHPVGVRKPIFRYVHLLMPHAPYGFDSVGKPMHVNSPRDSADWIKSDSAYLQYLVYTNKVILGYVKSIKNGSQNKAIILLMSDHGYRHASRLQGRYFEYMVINAVYLPGKDYKRFYNGISHVNQFRVLFNTSFGQNFPLLKDSIVLEGTIY